MEIRKTTIEQIDKFRTAYLNSLPQFQELFLEFMISDSDCYIFQLDTKEIGYAIIHNGNTLIEFYLLDGYISQSNLYFTKALNVLSVKDIYCKSFDALLLSNCLLNGFSYSLLGVLYRDFISNRIKRDVEVRMQKVDAISISFLLGQDSSIKELFETEEQLAHFIRHENVFNFFKNEDFIGCGMVLRTNRNWDYCDLGVWVEPSNRGNSLGAQILMNLREFAISKKMLPSCGCAIDNIASQKTIEKCGFVSKYKLINFKSL